MKRKFFLITGMLLASFSMAGAQTILFQNGFESDNADKTATGWYEYINNQTGDTRELNADAAHTGAFGCHFYNDAATMGASWQRAIKFRNLSPKEGTSYRLSFYLKGENQYIDADGKQQTSKAQAALMCGEENADIPFLSADSTQFTYSISNFSESEFKKYTLMFYYANAAIQQTYYKNHKNATSPDAELADKFFATINMYNPGDYYLDDVEAIESTIAGIYFNQDMIKVDFGYSTNIAALAKTVKAGKLQLPTNCVKVNLNGTDVSVNSVEVQSDGYLYIFLGDVYSNSATDKIIVSFTNPTDADQLLYTASLRPNSTSESKAVLNFSDETGTYDETLNVTSVAYDPPTLVTSDPENGSFDLPLTTNTFNLKFDKPINIDKAVATLTGGSIKDEKLTFNPSTGYSQSVTLTRSASTELTKDEYSIHIGKVIGKLSYADDICTDTTITINLGNATADPNDTAYVLIRDSFYLGKQSSYPNENWKLVSDNTTQTPNASGGGSRLWQLSSKSDFQYGIYLGQRSVAGGSYLELGTDARPLPLKSSKYQVHFNLGSWDGAGHYAKCEIYNPDGTIISTTVVAGAPSVPSSSNYQSVITGTTSTTVDFKATAGNYKIRFTPCDKSGSSNITWQGVLLGNVYVTYIPSAPGADYKAAFSTALANAKQEYANDNLGRYAGPALNALADSIKNFDGKTYTAPSSYTTATNALLNATKTMIAHKKLITTYDPLVAAAQAVIDKYAGTKYASDASYPALQQMIDKYKGQVLMQDDSLTTAISELTNATTLCTNMCANVINNYTNQLMKAVETAKKIGISADDADIIAANATVTDNQQLVGALNDKIRVRLYKNLAEANDTTFGNIDPTTTEFVEDSIDMTSFIHNPNLYVTTSNTYDITDGVCPGWNATKVSGGWSQAVNWWTSWSGHIVNSNYPAAKSCFASWAHSAQIKQDISGLPTGVYSLLVGYGERCDYAQSGSYSSGVTTHFDTPFTDSLFIVVNGDTVKYIAPYITGSTIPNLNVCIKNIEVKDGKLTIGTITAADGHTFTSNAALYMTAKAKNFDYSTGVKGVNDNSATIKNIEYFGIGGQRINSPTKGITIIKQTYSDGSVKVKKQLKN